MKKILHISNFNLIRLKGCFQVGFPIKISNGLTRNGYYVMNYPDRDLARMLGFGFKVLGQKRLNKHLIEFCKNTKPDALLIGHADLIDVETIAEIKRLLPGVRVMQWSCDWIVPKYAERNIKALHKYLPVIDSLMVSTGDEKLLSQFKTPHNVVEYLPNMADASIESFRAFEKEQNQYDMFLAANTGLRQFCGEDAQIEEIVGKAKAAVPDLKWKLAGIMNEPQLNGFEYLEALGASSMGLNLSRLNNVYHYSSDRMVHLMANGVLAFVDRRTGFNDMFSEDEVAFYSDEAEFLDKIKFFKDNPQARMKAAKSGWEKVHSEFSDVAVTAKMAKILFG